MESELSNYFLVFLLLFPAILVGVHDRLLNMKYRKFIHNILLFTDLETITLTEKKYSFLCLFNYSLQVCSEYFLCDKYLARYEHKSMQFFV
jgi:hypothetical protein